MANNIPLVCPKCNKQMTVPATLAGKKVKCKGCATVIAVKAPAATSHEARRAALVADFDEDNQNPYGMIKENLAARCPHCALPLDPPDARICLHCGYDMQKRKRHDRETVYENTFGDYLIWHLPTIACFFGIWTLVGIVTFLGINMKDWWEGAWLDGVIRFEACTVWCVILAAFPCWSMGKIIYRKLFKNFTPPEKKKKDEYED